MIAGFTGTRHGLTSHQQVALDFWLEQHKPDVFAHGDCVGADAQAHAIVRKWAARTEHEIHIVGFPPANASLRAWCRFDTTVKPGEYLVRNRAIVDFAETIIACPKDAVETARSGTWAAIRYARKLGKPMHIILPDGALQREYV